MGAGESPNRLSTSDRDVEAALPDSQTQSVLEGKNHDTTTNLDSGASTDSKIDRDPNVVDWDGPDDPENPLNWPEGRKWLSLSLISVMTLVT